jgi:DNA (cytosine-5)-methyltransferase 1
LHPVDPSRSRLLTAAEHARIKGIDPAMLVGASETVAHQVCGQSVDTRPLKALAHRLAMALLVAEDGLHRGAAAPEGWQSVHG